MTKSLVPDHRDDGSDPRENSQRRHDDVERHWRKERPPVPWKLWRFWLLLAGIGLAVIAMALVFLASWIRPPRSIDLVLLGADYGDNLLVPQNTYGWNVIEEFASLANDPQLQTWGTRLIRLAHPVVELHSDSCWKNSLRVNGENPVLIYVSAHGTVGENGPYLLFGDACATNTKQRLPLADFLRQLAQLPTNQQKIVVLECTSMTSQWSLGVLRNDFARSLEQLESQIQAIPNLVVISASSPDEHSWSCGAWRQSVFGHYLLDGLRGGVDDTNHDGRIDLWDLYAGVRDKTNSWVQANRAARQTPMILPRDKAGYERARGIDLAPMPRHYRPQVQDSLAVIEIPDEVVRAWETHQRLARRLPSPAVHTPLEWRRYRDLLIRFEELMIAGNREDAAAVRRRLLASGTIIDRDLSSGLSSIQNSLGMYDALRGTDQASLGSVAGARDVNAKQALEKLWAASAGKLAKEWDKLCSVEKNDPVAMQHMRMALQPLVIQRVSEAPAENISRGCDLIRILDDPLHARPAEAHFLLMLADGLPQEPWDDQRRDLVRLALDTRQQAERTAWNLRGDRYAYFRQAFRHIRDSVEAADKERRFGEDLLLSDAGDRKRSRELLQKANDLYRQAEQVGAAIGNACDIYQQTIAELPYYARWVAGKRSDFMDSQVSGGARLSMFEDLCRETHQLGTAIRPENCQGESGAETQVIVAQTEQVENALARFEAAIFENWQLIASDDSTQTWCDIHNALCVPQQDGALRMKILRRLLQTERRGALDQAEGRPPASQISRRQQTKFAKRAARVEGRLAMAMLGRETYRSLTTDRQLTHEQVLHALDVFDVEDKWWNSVALVGRAVGDAWTQVAAKTDEAAHAAQRANQQSAIQLLARAEMLSRLTPGYCQLSVNEEPAWESYRADLNEILQWQADRSWNDHWYAERPDVAPYYRTAADAYLNDATRIYPRWSIDQKLKQRIAASGDLHFVVTDALDVSSQRRMNIPLRLASERATDVPEGFPVVWFEVGSSLQLSEPCAVRNTLPWRMAKQGDSLICQLTSKTLEDAELHPPSQPKVVKTQLAIYGRFRGQRIECVVPIQLHLAPDVTRISCAPPRTASVAVRADEQLHQAYGEGNGSIAIVLDCTGSMGPPADEPFSSTTKYAEATTALGRVLRRLPHGTTVSLWVFGQAVGPEKTTSKPENTIRQILSPVTWDQTNPAQLSDLLSGISYPALEPWNESPIVRAILAAKKDLEGAGGFKSIVVLTDGIDNRVAEDREVNPDGKDVPTLLRDAFQNSGIELNIVGFRMSGQDEMQGWQQFHVVHSLFPPGTFCTVSESESLAESLDNALRQRLRFWVEKPDLQNVQGMSASGLEVSRNGENNQWYPGGLAPGSYFLRVNANHRIDQSIALNRGDQLLVRVAKEGSGIDFHRVIYGQEDFSWKPASSSGTWRATLLQNQRIGNDRLEMLVGLESTREPFDGVLSIIRPDSAWVEIQPCQAESPTFRSACTSCWGFPTAAWRLVVPQWPRNQQKLPARSNVKMWWSFRGGTNADAVFVKPSDFARPEDLTGREVMIRGRKVVIESAGVEEHSVQVGPHHRQSQHCFVVRLRGCHDQPFWVQPWGIETVGAEHRFYQDIGHYMGLFWPVSKKLVDQSLARLELISLEKFKHTAEERGNHIQFKELPPPDPNDVGPQPVGLTWMVNPSGANRENPPENVRSTDQVHDAR
jgi:hypothetical protein